MVEDVRLAWKPGLVRSEVWERIRSLGQADGDGYRRMLLYVVLTTAHDTDVDDIASAHAVALAFEYERRSLGIGVEPDLASLVVGRWVDEISNRAFRLSAPKLLRNELDGMQSSTATMRIAARVVLAAEAAAGASYATSTRTALSVLAGEVK